MLKRPKAYFNWSSGKDAALALYTLQQQGEFEVDKLITTINGYHDRVSMHGLRRTLLQQQIKSLGLPVTTIKLPEQPSMEDYDRIMGKSMTSLKGEGYNYCGFGDIFLEDLKKYREKQHHAHGITCLFPLWKRDTKVVLEEFIALGFKAVVICAKAELLNKSFVGRELDASFLRDLPPNVDPCGENGEFHTFCYDGPIFSKPISFVVGEKVFRSYKNPEKDKAHNNEAQMGFWFCDLDVAKG